MKLPAFKENNTSHQYKVRLQLTFYNTHTQKKIPCLKIFSHAKTQIMSDVQAIKRCLPMTNVYAIAKLQTHKSSVRFDKLYHKTLNFLCVGLND